MHKEQVVRKIQETVCLLLLTFQDDADGGREIFDADQDEDLLFH